MLSQDNNERRLAFNQVKRARPEEKTSSRRDARQTRHRVSRACDFCRIKKAKCDGGDPCAKCSRSNTSCTYRYVRKISGSQTAAGYAEQLARQQSILVACVHELYRQLKTGQDHGVSNVTCCPPSGISVNDIVASLGLDRVDIAEADDWRHPRASKSTTSSCAASTKQHDGRDTSVDSPCPDRGRSDDFSVPMTTSIIETSPALSTTGDRCSTTGTDLEGSDQSSSSTPASATEWNSLFDLDAAGYYDPIDFTADSSFGDSGQSSWQYPWLQQELY